MSSHQYICQATFRGGICYGPRMNLVALQSPSFRAYLFSVAVALHGFWAKRVIIGWLAWELTGSAAFVGFVSFLNLAPTFLCGPFFGVIADRIDVRRASIVNYASVCLITFGFVALTTTSWLTAWAVAGFSLATGLISSLNHPVRMSLTPRLAPAAHMSSVIALTATNFNVSRLLGPVMGGALIQAVGATAALFVAALCYVPVVITLNFVTARDRATSTEAVPTGFIAALVGGIRYALDHHLIRLGIILSGFVAIAGRSVLETLPVLADGVFNAGPTGLGLMTAGAGVGALAASLAKVLGRGQLEGTVPPIVLVMALVTPGLVSGLSVIDQFWQALILTVMLGFSITIVAVSLQSMIQMELPDHYRGRVMGLWTMVSIGGGAVGAMLMGTIGDLFGISMAQICIGGGMFVLCFYTATTLRKAGRSR